MRFNQHSGLSGSHALLSPSKYHWVIYSEDQIDQTIVKSFAAARGTALHNLAKDLIILKQNLPDTTATLNAYVNDAIGFRMTPEQTLFYSLNCYGTADAISFRQKKLRIHDLKTGVNPTSVTQLEVYTALFCLEYDVNPNDIEIELRIYQNDEVRIYNGDPLSIFAIMDKIRVFDARIEQLRMEAYG